MAYSTAPELNLTNILLESGTNELEIVEFYGDEILTDADGKEYVYRGYYGVNVAKVLEIIRMPEVTELPESQHPSILGAFNLRSRIVPLVDLALWLGKKHVDAPYENAKTIVTEFNNLTTGFSVTGVNRIHRISWEAVEPPSPYVAALSGNTVIGVVKIDERIIFLLDLEKIVTDLNPQLGLKLDDLGENWNYASGYKALIADDSALIRAMQQDLLEKAGFCVDIKTTGRGAWERLLEIKKQAAEQNRPISDFVNVVVSDIEMPVMDGHNLTRRIKEDPELKHLPVLLFSSIITDKLRHKGISVGADDQISKPEVGQLARRAISLIEKNRQSEKS